MKCSNIFLCPEDTLEPGVPPDIIMRYYYETHIILLLWLPVEEDHLAVVPAPVLLLDVGQVEAGRPQSLPVAGIHLGDPAVVGLGVQEVVGAVCGVVVVPREERKMLLVLSIILLTPQSCLTLDLRVMVLSQEVSQQSTASRLNPLTELRTHQMNIGVSLPLFSH